MNVYEIFTKLTLQSTAAGVLGAIAKEVLNLESGVGRLQKAFTSLNATSLAAGGGLMLVAGGGLAYGIKKAADAAKELSHQLVQIQQLRISPTQFEQARSMAFGMHAQVPGATSVDALKVYGQIYSPLGHENALKMTKPLLEFSQVLGNMTGDYKGATDKVYEMVRAGDLMGKFMNSAHQVDVSGLQRFLDLGARVVLATHGKVSADTWFQMAQQGGPALSGMTDQGLLTMGIVAQMMKGPRAGTALMSLFQQMRGGIMTQWRAQELHELGLVGQYHVQKGGHLTWDKGALDTPFIREFSKDPAAGVKILVDALRAHGITNQDAQVNKLYEILQRQTSIREIHDLLRNLPQIIQERGRIAGGLGVSAAVSLQNAKDYEQVMHNFDAAWSEMMMHVGLPVTKVAIEYLQTFTGIFDQMGEFAKKHGASIQGIAQGLALLSISLTALGATGIIMGLLRLTGPFGLLISLGAGIGYLVYQNFDSLNKYVHQFSTYIRDLGTGAFEKVIGWVKSFGSEIQWLWDKLSALNPFHHESYEGSGFGDGALIHRASLGAAFAAHAANASAGGSVSSSAAAVAPSGGWRALGRAGLGGPNPILAAIDAATAGDARTRQIMRNIYASESGHGAHYDHNPHGEDSWGPFQLNRQRGLGALFEKETGLSVRTQATLGAQARWVADYIKRHRGALSQWRGLLNPRAFHNPLVGGFDPHAERTPHIEPPRKREQPPIIHNTILLDGEPIHRSVVKRIVKGMTHPTTAPYHDGSRHWTPPDAGLVGV